MKANSKCQNDDCVLSGECHYHHTNECTPEFEPFGWTPLQIATYAINCPKEDKYFEEVAHMIERYADTRIWQELELPAANYHTCKNCGSHCECSDQPCSCCANEINLGTIG